MPSVSLTLDQAADKIADIGWANASSSPVTYGFRSSGGAGFERFTAAQIAATQQALALWSDVANIKFQRAGASTYTNSATMLFSGDTSDPTGYAWAYFPGSRGSTSIDGNVYLNPDGGAFDSLPAGSYEFMSLVHEIGHAIGLDHPGAYNGGAPTYATNAEYKQDSMQYTLMSYFDAEETGASHRGIYAATPLLHDIAAAQLLYGANGSTRAGNTVYGFGSNANRAQFHIDTPTEKAVFAIWDGGGADTLNFSGYRQGSIIDLNEAAFSSVGGLIKNVAIADNCIIEHAIGGWGNDRITGNAQINRLVGNGGNDTLRGGGASDALIGGAGADSFLIDIAATLSNADRIVDFNPVADAIRIENFVFDAIGPAGRLAAGAFYVGAAAHDANDRIIYQRATGFLFYDEDGAGGAAAVKIAAFTSSVKPLLTAADIIVF